MKVEEKRKKFDELLTEVATLTDQMESDEANDTSDNRDKLKGLLDEAEKIRKSIEQDNQILGLKDFQTAPAHAPKALGGDGVVSQPFAGMKSIGEQFIESEAYKSALVAGKVPPQMRTAFEAKGYINPSQAKATFTSTSTGLVSGLEYIPGIVLKEQQRLTIRDLLSVGQTTLNQVNYIQETSFTNAADMVAEEGEKPEATLLTQDAHAPVKKIAVVLKVTDEMFADFPMLRDYINSRLRWMVVAKEEQQLLYGTGGGNQITGILQSSPQTTSATSPGEFNAIMTAKTKVALTANGGGFQADGLVIHPEDWEGLRLTKDGTNGQYLGGGPFTGAYGNGQFIEEPRVWGLRPVITEAITKGTALVGAFKLGAQVWQREGISMDATNSNEDDFNFNRVTLRVEERLALAVYRPKAFCTITDIAF